MDDTSATRIRATIDRELSVVEGAVRMVASGGSRSLTVGGLRFGEEVRTLLAAEAAQAGVRIDAIWRADEHGCDLRVHRSEDPGVR